MGNETSLVRRKEVRQLWVVVNIKHDSSILTMLAIKILNVIVEFPGVVGQAREF